MRFFSIVMGVVLAAGVAHADEPKDTSDLPAAVTDTPEELQVIQNRKYALATELALLPGVLPADPYYKGVTTSLGYTWHFSDFWAWEIGQFTYSFNLDTSLKERLLQIATARGQSSPSLPEINWIVTSRLVLKPFYGKEALFNTNIVHLEAYFLGGPAVVSRSAPISSVELGLDVGAGLRLWLTRVWSLRLELGELLHVEREQGGTKIRQAPHISLGFSANLRGED